MEKNKLALLVGAAPIGEEKKLLFEYASRDDAYIVAVDGGLNYLRFHGISPSFIIGDMDSALAGYEGLIGNVPFEKVPVIKDDTDMGLALRHVADMGYREVAIFGGAGGMRMSHTFANVQLMHKYSKCGIKVTMYSDKDIMCVLTSGELTFDESHGGYISVLALTDEADVSIKGLFYEYTGTLTNEYALGQSNEFIGKKASVFVERGAVLVIWGL